MLSSQMPGEDIIMEGLLLLNKPPHLLLSLKQLFLQLAVIQTALFK